MENKPIFDVSRPGESAAQPSGKPVITGNQPIQTDPMMSQPAPNVPVTPVAPAPEHAFGPVIQSPPAVNTQSAAEPLHKLAHEQAFYGQVNKPKRGRKILLFFVLVIIFGVGGYGAWKYRQNQDKKSVATQTKPVAQKKTQDIKVTESEVDGVYKNPSAGWQINNKYNWKIAQKTKSDKTIVISQDVVAVDIKINDTQVVTFTTTEDGSDSECTPKQDDKAFQKGNECNSYKLLAVDKLPETAAPLKKLTNETDGIQVVKFDFLNPLINNTTYTLVSIESHWKPVSGQVTEVKVGEAVMTGVPNSTKIYLKSGKSIIVSTHNVNSNDIAQLNDQDLNRLYEVLKTFKLL